MNFASNDNDIMDHGPRLKWMALDAGLHQKKAAPDSSFQKHPGPPFLYFMFLLLSLGSKQRRPLETWPRGINNNDIFASFFRA